MNRLAWGVACALSSSLAQVPAAARADTVAAASLDAPSRSQSGVVAVSPSSPPSTLPVGGAPVVPALPRRHEGRRLVWDPAFHRVETPELVLTSIAVGVALAGAIAPPLHTGWQGGILVDDDVRHALRLPTYQARLDARDASDVGLAFVTTFPILVDSPIVAYWYRGSDDVALQMTLIDAEAMAISAALQGTANFFAGRERPYGVDCGGQVPGQSVDCVSTSRYRSFFSGHSALSFTSAALICAHHMSLDLFDSAADPVTCVSGFLAAGAVATLRIVGDMHYLSDVLTGALVGTAVGLGFPLLHHYKRSLAPAASSGLDVRIVPTGTGAAFVGTF
jgi:membrane-associated phospholipid phosphatase